MKRILQISLQLVIVLGLFLVPSPKEAEAQSGNVQAVIICVNEEKGRTYKINGSVGTCLPGWGRYLDDLGLDIAICVALNSTSKKYQIVPFDDEDDCTNVLKGRYQTIASITTAVPTTIPPINTNTNTGGGGNLNTKPPVTKPPVQNQGDCQPGFHEVGATCVPDRKDCDGIVCVSTAGELATMVLRIMLFFAGIISVVFAVIGGYAVTTAQGNDEQRTKGIKTLRNALIGLAIVLASYTLVELLINTLTTKSPV